MVKTNQFERNVVEKVLERYANSSPLGKNALHPKANREELAKMIMESLEYEWRRRLK
jgi:hypothetical protein